MAFYPATLEPITESRFTVCGHAGCTTLATFVVKAGGQEQLFCCAQCGALAVKADKQAPGQGWSKKRKSEKRTL